MLDYLFVPGTTHGKLLIRNLRIEAKVMLVLCTHNVIPRRHDKVEVRFAEVPVVYMLLHGSPLVPFQFLVLNNIWIRQNSGERKIVPHCRLITALMKLYAAIRVEDKGSYKRFKPFDIQHLGPGSEYKESEIYHKLKSDGKRWRASKVDARPLQPGEADEPESSDGDESGDDDYRVDTFIVDIEMRGAGPSGGVNGVGTQSGYIGSAFDYARQPYDSYWAHSGNMEQVVEQRRPPTFVVWSEPNQMLFDQQTYMGASVERALKQSYD
ncbi:hypothetical protein HanOQP8_Chr10g0361191 [Helianthus annuus]|nr:hypothetical protein HanOQP8_Chr10g0361191 [Helianthus annuus]KAJ0883324.1 hypothetical protein HanPSC8_Chr10g0420171 [Helianthus annuus]